MKAGIEPSMRGASFFTIAGRKLVRIVDISGGNTAAPQPCDRYLSSKPVSTPTALMPISSTA